MTSNKFGKYLKEKRLERKITLRELASAVGISAPYLSDIEKGNRNPPSLDKVERMAAALQMNPLEAELLLKWSGKKLVPHISAPELTHRLCNGFNTHFGYVVDENGEPQFVDLWKEHGINVESCDHQTMNFMDFLDVVLEIIQSIPTIDAVETEYTDYNPNDYEDE